MYLLRQVGPVTIAIYEAWQEGGQGLTACLSKVVFQKNVGCQTGLNGCMSMNPG